MYACTLSFHVYHIKNTVRVICFAGDFGVEIWSELSYFAMRLVGRRPLQSSSSKTDFGQAFGVAGYSPAGVKSRGGAYKLPVARMSYDDDIRLTPYTA